MSRKKRIFNFQHAVLGFLDTGFPIFLVNLTVGSFFSALRAGILQGIITFTIVGFNTAFHEHLLRRKGKFVAIILPSILTTGISYLIHTINNSPTPGGSAAVIFIFAIWNFSLLVFLKSKFGTIQPTKLIKKLFRKIKKKTSYEN